MQKLNQTNKLAICAVATALSIVFLMIGSVLPGVRIALTAVAAGITAALVIILCGMRYGVLSIAATALLGMLLVPAKEIVLLYACFFGPYAAIKNLIERLNRFALEWTIKLIYCGASALLLITVSDALLGLLPPLLAEHVWLSLPAILLVFSAYDVVFSKLIAYFCRRLHIV